MSEEAETEGELVIVPDAQLWKQSKMGAPRKFETAEDLKKACEDYFQWVIDNPVKPWMNTKAGLIQVPRIRPMTLTGLCIFLDISDDTWRNWRADRKDLLGVITRVEQIIYENKFSGAVTDQFNANIIARDLGLVDKSQLEGKIESNTTIDASKLSGDVLEALLAAKSNGKD